jgi:LuxR family maltose regulon positive regulatory protein
VVTADALLSAATGKGERLREAAEVLRSRVGACGELRLVEALRTLRLQHPGAVAQLEAVADRQVWSVVPVTQLMATVLLARLHAEEGDHYRALARLRSAVDRAEARGAVRPLVEVGGDAVLSMLRAEAGSWSEHEAFVTDVVERAATPVGPRVPLTDRELDVLRELPTLRTVEEIADVLVVSVNTVKTHLRSVYRKLGVASRRDAIAEARRCGVL